MTQPRRCIDEIIHAGVQASRNRDAECQRQRQQDERADSKQHPGIAQRRFHDCRRYGYGGQPARQCRSRHRLDNRHTVKTLHPVDTLNGLRRERGVVRQFAADFRIIDGGAGEDVVLPVDDAPLPFGGPPLLSEDGIERFDGPYDADDRNHLLVAANGDADYPSRSRYECTLQKIRDEGALFRYDRLDALGIRVF